MIYTDNVDYGLQKMETKLSLLLLPIVLPSLKSLNFSYYKRTFTRVFIATIFVAAMICIIRAIYLYSFEQMAIQRGEERAFFYRGSYFYGALLSNFLMHPGYLAMYANVALITVLYQFKKQHPKGTFFLKIFTILFLSVFILLLYSATGIIVLLIVLMSFAIRYTVLEKKKIHLIFGLLAAFVLSSGIYFFYDGKLREQFFFRALSSSEHNPNSTETIQLRIHAWKASQALIDKASFFGYGTGDTWDVLAKEYEARGYNAALLEEVNSHNTFYQIALALGYFGLFALVLIFVYWIWFSWKKQHFPLFLWVVVTALAFTFESYFNTQDGVIYTSLFLFFVYSLNQQDDE